MSLFSLDWFKSNNQKKLEELEIKRREKELELLTPSQNKQEETEKPYKMVKLVNNVLTVVLHDGSILNKPGATTDDFVNVRQSVFEEEIFMIMIDQQIASERKQLELEIKKNEALKHGLSVLKNLSDFRIEGDNVYLSGINRTLPQLLVEKFIEIAHEYSHCPQEFLQDQLDQDEEYQSLKRFFMWCALNPRAEVANELYRFLRENSFRITKQGFFVALRNVVTLHGSPELVHFVSNTYNKVKAVWKKNPANYTVFLEDGEYKLVHDDQLYTTEIVTSTTCPDCDGEGELWNDWDEYEEDYGDDVQECENCMGTGEVEEYEYSYTVPVYHGEKIGNLVDLYLDLPNREENRFTDDWTKTFDIRVGKVVNMPKEECNWSTQDCAAAGLHFTADQIHYVGCGDQSVLVLINPMKVVGIGQHKGRCYEYLPIMTVPREEATSILHDVDFDTLELDEDYAIRELDSLAEKVKEGFAAEAKKHQFNLPTISTVEIINIIESLDEMKNVIENRVVNLD